jgi:hypothetical protein
MCSLLDQYIATAISLRARLFIHRQCTIQLTSGVCDRQCLIVCAAKQSVLYQWQSIRTCIAHQESISSLAVAQTYASTSRILTSRRLSSPLSRSRSFQSVVISVAFRGCTKTNRNWPTSSVVTESKSLNANGSRGSSTLYCLLSQTQMHKKHERVRASTSGNTDRMQHIQRHRQWQDCDSKSCASSSD